MITKTQQKRLNRERKLRKPPLLRTSAKKLLEVKAAILREPELYNQGAAPDLEYDNNLQVDARKSACGTPACMVGWLMWEESKSNPKKYVDLLGEFGGASQGFVEILGVTDEEADRLYVAGFSDEEYEYAARNPEFYRSKGQAREAMLGAARIDLFIESHRLI